MSRIGELPINIPSEVKLEISGQKVSIKGPKGDLEIELPRQLSAKIVESEVLVEKKGSSKTATALHGTYRAHLSNAVLGVKDGWKKELEIVGTGYKAEVRGKELVLTIGYSHPVTITAPEGVAFKVEKMTVTVDGIDKHAVGQTAANVRKVRPPEPYKGKGIRYKDEAVRRKAGKAAKTAGAA